MLINPTGLLSSELYQKVNSRVCVFMCEPEFIYTSLCLQELDNDLVTFHLKVVIYNKFIILLFTS